MLKKLDDLLFKGLHLGLLGFFLYIGITYAPNSIATLILCVIAGFTMLWFTAKAIFKIIEIHTDKKLSRHYR